MWGPDGPRFHKRTVLAVENPSESFAGKCESIECSTIIHIELESVSKVGMWRLRPEIRVAKLRRGPATLVGEGGLIRVDIGMEFEEGDWLKCAAKGACWGLGA